MGLPFLGAVRDLVTARADMARVRVAAALLTALLGLAAAALVCAAGLVALSDAVGFPVAALVIAALLAGLALGVSVVARKLASGKRTRAADAKIRAGEELAVAMALTRSAQPLLPLAALLAVFLLARRS